MLAVGAAAALALLAPPAAAQAGPPVPEPATGPLVASSAARGEVTVAGKPVTVTLPSWATYRLGESAAAE